ncbi:hypothetical protein G7046_g4184 [Stylonectria norvegica]|nr:hypothetical protein G7046_g4184 [Stylonectria norvegica]
MATIHLESSTANEQVPEKFTSRRRPSTSSPKPPKPPERPTDRPTEAVVVALSPSLTTMFGPFRITNPLSGGLLWKIPWRLSKFQKRRHRLRLRAVDSVVATVDAALAKQGQTLEALERWKAEMPTEAEMLPRDKYTMFDRKEKKYRKGIHKLPKWTRVSQRVNPPGY